MLRWLVYLGSLVVTWAAVSNALYELIGWVCGPPAGVAKLWCLVMGAVMAYGAAYAIRRKVNAVQHDGYAREYINAAWLCVSCGVVLMTVEEVPLLATVFQSPLSGRALSFAFEDLLLGFGALCALAEEVRMYRQAATNRGPFSASVTLTESPVFPNAGDDERE